MSASKSLRLFGLLTAALAGMTCAGAVLAQDRAQEKPLIIVAQAGDPARAASELDSLIRAARKEGELTFYSAVTENVAKRAAEAYSAKYGVKVAILRLSSAPLMQRYANEAASGNFAADVVVASGAGTFVADNVKKGWSEPLSEARIPAVISGEFPARYYRGISAIIGVQPWLIFYHTERVKGADIPKDWPDLLDPKWKGKLILADPRASDAYIPLWTMFLDKYGESFFAGLRAQGMRAYGGVPAVQALAAGEGSVGFPQVRSTVQDLRDKGAPVDSVTPSSTTGTELELSLASLSKAKHPNAARLFAHYVMTAEGNKVFNSADPGSFSIYDTSRLPRAYESPKSDAVARKELVFKLLGLQ